MKILALTGSCFSSDCASGKIPVPASKMISSSASLRTSIQVVLPPYRAVCGPGEAIEPRTPQKRIFIRRISSALLGFDLRKALRFGHEFVQVSQTGNHGFDIRPETLWCH